MVTAIIRPAKLDDVMDALEALGADKLTATEVRGIGHGSAALAQADYGLPVAPTEEIEIEVAVSNALLPQVLAALRAAALTGKLGDGKILVANLDGAVRIRNGTRGDAAL